MNDCCKETLKKAADVVAGSVPSPICLSPDGSVQDRAKRMKAMLPLVGILFHARDRIIALIPGEPSKERVKDNLEKYSSASED